MANSAAPFLTLLICDPVKDTHFVFAPPALLRAQNPLRAFATHWAWLQASASSWDEMVIFIKHNVGRRKSRPPVLDLDQGVAAASEGLETLHLEPVETHLLVSETKSDVRTGVCPGAAAIVMKAEFEISAA